MKVTNWRKKIIASIVAGGFLTPAAVDAANLDTNLLANPGFESVDPGTVGVYNAPKILNWAGINAFAYSHNPGVTGIPDYADGADPPGAGSWYFSANNNPPAATGDIRNPNEVYQDLDVSTGPTGTQIGLGEAAYKLSAYMSSYLNDNDAGDVQLDFKNAGGTIIGSALIRDSDAGPNNVWSLTSLTGIVPVGTATIRRVDLRHGSQWGDRRLYRQCRCPDYQCGEHFIIPRSEYDQRPSNSEESDRCGREHRLLRGH